MAKRFYNLPSLTALVAFESVARHLSFKFAAAELNVTTGAISHQVKAIEEEIGVALFNRTATGVTLTAAGEDLYGTFSQALSRTSEAIQRVKKTSSAARVTLASSHSMATMWLIPRMGSFRKQNPGIIVDHLLSDLQRDYRRADVELRIRYGSGAWPDETSHLLFDEVLYPVCSPEFLKENPVITRGTIASLPLLHVDWAETDWTDWDEFLRRADIAHGPLPGVRMNNFFATLQACEGGHGLAVGWHRLVDPLIQAGKLTRVTDISMPAPGSYYLTWNDKRDLSSAAQALRAWLIEEAKTYRAQQAAA